MKRSLDPFGFLASVLAGWANQQQQDALEYLREKTRVLREHLTGTRIRYTDNQRRRLAAKAKALGRKALDEVATLVSGNSVGLASQVDRSEVRRQ